MIMEPTSQDDIGIPLCVDLDATLIRSDTLAEGVVRLIQQNIWYCFAILGWSLRGRAALRAKVAARVELDVSLLPVNEAFLEWLRQQRGAGRRLVLCSAASAHMAQRVGLHYGLFDEAIASDMQGTARGRQRADLLLVRFGEQRFDYAGSDAQDLPVWEKARRAVIVAPGWAMQRRLSSLPRIERVFAPGEVTFRSWIHALRLHQWSKNVLIFLPAAAAHRLSQHAVAFECVLAFLIFGWCASGTYILNDLMDLDADRAHPRKRSRPFAAGQLPLAQGLLGAPALVGAGLVLAAWLLGWLFFATLALYVVATVWYSRSLKRVPMVDVLVLAGLYSVRVIAGAAATAIVPSFWLLAFTMFLFLSLAMAKRYSELKLMIATGRTHASGRGYTIDDAPLLQACGVSSGYISVLVVALYVNSGVAQSTYTTPEFLWLLCPLLLYWNSRIWLKTSRGQMHEDPVVFTLRDRPSLAVACLGLLLIWAAT